MGRPSVPLLLSENLHLKQLTLNFVPAHPPCIIITTMPSLIISHNPSVCHHPLSASPILAPRSIGIILIWPYQSPRLSPTPHHPYQSVAPPLLSTLLTDMSFD
ncbi:hypothetical protein HPP92_012731 [Vanilla planifolia]|uniref:Uncharacterized protein n=1 Tax=Vanilla planifolia TaxID=51239 RepID=A0A835QT74_VANPL|nr:hypothetical protein HPP92_012731 [Vanilla planifolia]